jgi:hypothetical protein
MLRAPALSIRTVGLFIGLLALLVATIALPGGAGAQTTSRVVVPVRGELEDGSSFRGRMINPDVIYRESTDSLRISGILAGTVTQADGTTERVRQQFNTGIRVHQDPDNCNILFLRIGRIHLDLLGLVVVIEPIEIDVTAVPGPGNLLGNLLCAVAGLLDPNGPLADFLDDLLAALFTRT